MQIKNAASFEQDTKQNRGKNREKSATGEWKGGRQRKSNQRNGHVNECQCLLLL